MSNLIMPLAFIYFRKVFSHFVSKIILGISEATYSFLWTTSIRKNYSGNSNSGPYTIIKYGLIT